MLALLEVVIYRLLSNLMNSTSGEIIIGGEFDEDKCYIAPTVIDNVKPTDPIMQEEIFGPLLPILSCSNLGKYNYLKPLKRSLAGQEDALDTLE